MELRENASLETMNEQTTAPVPNKNDDPLQTNAALQYGFLIALLVVLSVVLYYRKRKK